MSIKKPMQHSLCAATALALIGVMGLKADAGTRSYSYVQSQSEMAPQYTPQYASATGPIVIQSPGQSAKTRSVMLPYSKSTVIESPAEIMDVIISNPDIVEAMMHTSHRAVLIGKTTGQTNAYFYGRNGEELLNLEIRVERDSDGLRSLISQHTEGSSVEVQTVNNNILLSGMVQNAAMANKVEALAQMWLDENTGGGSAGKVVNLMTVRGKDQVMLKVRIVEMQRSVSKQMGLNLNVIGELGDSTLSLISNNATASGAGLSGAFNIATGGSISSISGAFDALERVGLIRTLAEPTLTAISGESAKFLAGGEFPVLTNVFIDESGRPQREFEYKEYGVSLGFTPVVLSEGRISLNIATEVSEPTTENSFETGGVSSDILGLRKRSASTVVEMPAGASLMIAGLIREESRAALDGVPILKDVPGIGAAFRSRDETTTQTELVVMVTPYLVDPTHPDKLQTPLDGFQPPSDGEALWMGRINRVYGENSVSAPRRPGAVPFGHVVD